MHRVENRRGRVGKAISVVVCVEARSGKSRRRKESMQSRTETRIAIVEHPKTPAALTTQHWPGANVPCKNPSEEDDFTGNVTIQVMHARFFVVKAFQRTRRCARE